MIKEILKKEEPVVYTCLLNDLKEDKLAHSYLFCGDRNPLKKKAAYLLAQSIIENNNDFACEECVDCKRIVENNHLDVLYIDGDSEMIKRDEIDYILSEFSKTAVEKSGRKVYIVNNINNSSAKVLNMILKFMEEPANANTYGIFISDDVSSLLETVVSRCERISFTSNDYSLVMNEYLEHGFDEMDAYLLSVIRHEYVEDDADYVSAKDAVFETIDSLNAPDYIPIVFYSDVFPLKNCKEILDWYLEIMIRILDDSIASKRINDSEYDSLVDKVHDGALGLLEVFLDIKAKRSTNSSIDVKLLFDQLCSRIIKNKIGN